MIVNNLNLNIKPIHKSNDLFAKIYNVISGEIIELTELFYGDIKAGSYYSLGDLFEDNSESVINFVNFEKYNKILGASEISPILMKVLENEDEANDKNPIYFLTEDRQEFSYGINGESIYSFTFLNWEFVGELSTICEHNTYYTKFPLNPNGEPYRPNYFNEIRFDEQEIEPCLEYLFEENITNPKVKTKGLPHTTVDNARKIDFLGNFNIDIALNHDNLTYYSEKKSFLEIRRDLVNQDLGNGYIAYFQSFLKINSNNKLDITYKIVPQITIDNLENKDRLIKYIRNYDASANSRSSFVQSSEELDFISSEKIKDDIPRQIKPFEQIDDYAPNKGTDTSPIPPTDSRYKKPLEDKNTEVIFGNRKKTELEIEIDFKNKKYFDDIYPSQILNLVNFEDYINGQYRIRKIRAVIEQTYTSYSLEKLEKIERPIKKGGNNGKLC